MSLVVADVIVQLLILMFAAYMLSRGAEAVSLKYGANFAGGVILAFVTTLPEYMFVFWACMKGEYGVAIGSAVGAALMLITLGYGLVILTATSISIAPVKRIELSGATRIDAIYLTITAAAAFILGLEGNSFDLKDGVLLIALFVGYVYHMGKNAMEFGSKHSINVTRKEILQGLGYLIVGGVIIVLVSERFVDSMIKLAHEFHISPIAIAMVIGPIASELPEKLTAFVTVMRDGRLAEISVCNFIGSKVNHNSLLFGTMPIIAFLSAGSAVSGVINMQFAAMTLLTFVATASIARRRLERWQGFLFVALYSVQLGVAFISR